jgi:hypothetical protein
VVASSITTVEAGRPLQYESGGGYQGIPAAGAAACVHVGIGQTLNGQACCTAHIIAPTDTACKARKRYRPLNRQVIARHNVVAATIPAVEPWRALQNDSGGSHHGIAATGAPARVHIGIGQTLNSQACCTAHIITPADTTCKTRKRDGPLKSQTVARDDMIASPIPAVEARRPLQYESGSG